MSASLAEPPLADPSLLSGAPEPGGLREGAFGNATGLSCRECGHRSPLGPHYACPECFGPLVAAVIEGREAISSWRTMMGATDPAKAAPCTIRGDLATVMSENVSHGSDSPESAAREIALFFPGLA